MLLPMIQAASESSPDLPTHGSETNPAIPVMFLCMQGQAVAVRTFLRLQDGGALPSRQARVQRFMLPIWIVPRRWR
jgi:hypothetical protein